LLIPSQDILNVIHKAEEVLDLQTDEQRLRANLEEQARNYARILGSQELSYEQMQAIISYAFVGTQGFESYMDMLRLVPDQNLLIRDFIEDPIESMRKSINLRILYTNYCSLGKEIVLSFYE
jgi:hypothetical protein